MHILSFVTDIFLTGYVVREVLRFGPEYRQLKRDIANGDTRARARVYRKAIIFEWVSALLALLAFGFDWSKLNPKLLALENTRWIRALQGGSPGGVGIDRGALSGIVFGLVVGTLGFVIARIRSNRRGITPATTPARGSGKEWWSKLMPDFSALVPTTTRERLLWVAVAVSAGICEEIVFRGWLLSTLHGSFRLGSLRLEGTALIVAAAVLFGLAHSYQGITGMVITAFAGLFFCGLYIATGSLLWPILLHIVVDVRFALLPSPRNEDPRAVYA